MLVGVCILCKRVDIETKAYIPIHVGRNGVHHKQTLKHGDNIVQKKQSRLMYIFSDQDNED